MNRYIRPPYHDVSTWKDELWSWLQGLRYNIGFPTVREDSLGRWLRYSDPVLLAEREELEADFWLTVNVHSLKCDQWVRWLEAIELLNLLATVSKSICWNLLVDIDSKPWSMVVTQENQLKRLGWTNDLFHNVRPRFEFEFTPLEVPTDEVLELILRGIPDAQHTAEFTRVRSLLIGLIGDRPYDRVVPVRLRFEFQPQTADEIDAMYRHSERRLAKGRFYIGALHGFKRIRSIAMKVAASQRHGSEGAGPVRVEAFGFYFSSVYVTDDARDCLHAIAATVPISSLAYGVSSRQQGIKNYFGPFLWRLLAPNPLLRPHLGVQQLSIEAKGILGHAQIIALCSALAHSQTLQTFSFTEDASTSDADAQVWASWLAFALFSPAACHRIRKVHLHVADRLELYTHSMELVLGHQRANPVAYLALGTDPDVGWKLDSPVTWPSTTLRLRADATIRGSNLPATSTVYYGNRPVLCHVAGTPSGRFVRILIPGVGFGYVDQQDVVATHPTPTRTTHTVRSLSLSADGLDVECVQAMMKLIGQPLTSLSLTDKSKSNVRQGLDAGRLVGSCHNLRRLRLDNLAILPGSLTTGADWGRKLQSLVLELVRLADTTLLPQVPLVNMRTRRELFPNLSSLYVRIYAGHESLEFQQFLLEMIVRPRLERIIIACNDPIQRQPFEQYSRLDGEPIAGVLPPSHKLAFLSVVSAGSSNVATSGHALNPDTIASIFELAAPSAARRMVLIRK